MATNFFSNGCYKVNQNDMLGNMFIHNVENMGGPLTAVVTYNDATTQTISAQVTDKKIIV
jgi:hypothetical protein